jgi:hypothetical protein
MAQMNFRWKMFCRVGDVMCNGLCAFITNRILEKIQYRYQNFYLDINKQNSKREHKITQIRRSTITMLFKEFQHFNTSHVTQLILL